MSRDKYRKLLEDAAKARGVPFEILDRMAMTESAYNPRAVSPKGAQGLFQIMPATQKEVGVKNPFDPAQSAIGGATYLRRMYDRFGDWKQAIAAYNAGPGAVEKYRGIPPYKETQGYVQKVYGNGEDSMKRGMSNRELIQKGMSLAGEATPEQFHTAVKSLDSATPPSSESQDLKAYAGARYKPSKLDTALVAGTGLLGAIATLLGGDKPREQFDPVNPGGHGAAPITGGQSYNAGPLQKQYGMQVNPYQSAIFSLLKG